MFYLLTVYADGATLLAQVDSMTKLDQMEAIAKGHRAVTYVQTGAYPFGPVFSQDIIASDEPDLFARQGAGDGAR